MTARRFASIVLALTGSVMVVAGMPYLVGVVLIFGWHS